MDNNKISDMEKDVTAKNTPFTHDGKLKYPFYG